MQMEKIETIGVIQAGGLGTRMRALTHDVIPKPMLEMNGKPMIRWQIEKMSEYGIEHFVIIIGHLGEKIREYFGDGSRFNVQISYIEEKEPLGSAGALYYLKEYSVERYLLVYGDVMFDMDITRWLKEHKKKDALITTVCHPNAHPYDSDLLEMNDKGQVTSFLWKKEKRTDWISNLVNAGLFLFEKEVLDYIPYPQKMDFEKEVINQLLSTGRVFGYRTSEYIKDTGTVERFFKASSEQRAGKWSKRNLSNMQKCIFLDRDGTINQYVGLVSRPEQLELESGATEAIKLLNYSGFLVIVITNQPVVARGMCTEDDVKRIHRKLETLLGNEGAYLNDIIFCPHHPDKGFPEENPIYKIECACRKPKIGMISEMVEKYNIDLSSSYIIGDTTIDIQMGINAGVKTVLLKTGEAGRDGKYNVEPDIISKNLLSAVKTILEKEGEPMDYARHIRDYLEKEREILKELDENEISDVMNVLENTRLSGNRVFICGNGGSAATASHFTCDFNKGVSYAQSVKYNFECLNDNIPMMMAIANDISYEDIFSEPLKNKMRKEDVLVAISGSGNSKNVVKAMEYAKSIGATTIGLVGYDGGIVKKLSDYCIHVKIDNMQIVEDVHMIMDHVMMFVLSGMKGANG